MKRSNSKATKSKVDPAPQMSMILDAKTSDTVTLIHAEKKAMRISADKMKAAAEMVKGNSPPLAPLSKRRN